MNPFCPVELSAYLLSPFPIDNELKATSGISGIIISGAVGFSGALTIVGSTACGITTVGLIIVLSPGTVGVGTVGAVTFIEATAPGVVTLIVGEEIVAGAVGGVTVGVVKLGIPPIVGIPTATFIVLFISGSIGSIGTIFAPTSISSLNKNFLFC